MRVAVKHSHKRIEAVMKREADIADLPLFTRFFELCKQVKFQRGLLPGAQVDRMEQIHIDIIRF